MRHQCKVGGCKGLVHGNDLCAKHYARVRRGKPIGTAKNQRDDLLSVTKDAILRKAFVIQRANAQRRSISFLLSFAEWISIWQKSGKLHLRGTGDGRYCMARIGDQGSYKLSNVCIITNNQNNYDGSIGRIRPPRSPQWRKDHSKAIQQWAKNPDVRAMLTKAGKLGAASRWKQPW